MKFGRRGLKQGKSGYFPQKSTKNVIIFKNIFESLKICKTGIDSCSKLRYNIGVLFLMTIVAFGLPLTAVGN